MEECKIEKKRSREDVEEVVFNSPEADAGLGMYSPEAKQIREDILDILDEQETLTDRLPEVMKSFEEEIVHPSTKQNILDLMSSDSIDPQPYLGYLQEASDNELGLPPTLSSFDDHVDAKINLLESENAIEFENELLPSDDSFELGSLEFSQFCLYMPA